MNIDPFSIGIGMLTGIVLSLVLRFWRKRIKGQRECILKLLQEHGELKGLDLVKKSNGILHRGTIYVRLGELVEEGVLKDRAATKEEDPNVQSWGVRRRVYSLAKKSA